MNWIRIAVAIGDDPDVHTLADRLGCRVAEAVGLVVCLLTRFPEHAPDGNLAQIPASLVERWAGWEGTRGEFDAAFRGIFLTDGVWPAWERHNGTALREAESSRLRAAEYRRRQADDLLNRTANGTANGTTDRTHLRTDGRTNLTTGRSRARNGEPPAPYRTDPFCPECGQPMGKLHPDDTKLVQLHAPTCSRRTE